jgi:predicted N-formylglutamate amidohydrolase
VEFQLYDVEDDEEPPVHTGQFAVSGYAEVELPHGLGRLGVDRSGAPVDIAFDEEVLRLMRPGPVGEYLVAALHEAEETARHQRIAEHRR